MASPIRPKDLDPGTPLASADVMFDSGSQVLRASPLQIVDAGRPLASQADAETGADNVKIVTSLRIKQGIDAQVKMGFTSSGGIGVSKSGGATFRLNTDAGQSTYLFHERGALSRWHNGASPDPETGGNVGTDYYIRRFNDAGSFIDEPFRITRSTGQLSLTVRPTWAGATPVDSANIASQGGNMLVTQPLAGATARSALDKAQDIVSVFDFMTPSQRASARANNLAVDCLSAFGAALASGATSIYVPAQSYRLSAGITIPPGVTLWSDGFVPGNLPRGTVLTFDLATPVCVTLGGAGSMNVPGQLRGVSIARAAGAIPAGSVGLLVEDVYAPTVAYLGSFRQAIGFKFKSDGTAFGINCHPTHLYTGAISDTHVEIDTWPEVRMSQCRFGMNGPGDLNCNSFIRIKGGSLTNGASGPNTIVATNCQFNQGANTVGAWIDFKDKLPGSIADNALWIFSDCYVETIANGIRSDASWNEIQRLQMSNITFSHPTTGPFLSLNAATQITDWEITNLVCNGSFTVNQTPQINFLQISNSAFLANVSIAGSGAGSSVLLSNNSYKADLSLTGNFGAASVLGGFANSFSNAATGHVIVNLANRNDLQTWTPALSFGGASTGISYATQQGTYQRIGRTIVGEFRITLISKGSAIGTAAINNLPVPVDGSIISNAGGGAVSYILNMTGLTGAVVANAGANLDFFQSAASGLSNVSDANFTNTTTIAGNFSYVTPFA